MIRLSASVLALAASFAAVMPAFGQPNLSYSYTLSDGNAHSLVPGATITFPSVDIGKSTAATVVISNTGNAVGTIDGLSLVGTGFTLSNPNLLPANIPVGGNLAFAIVFVPSQPGSFAATFQITLPGGTISANLAGATPPPDFSLEYVDPATGNILPLSSTAGLQFPNTQTATTSTINVLITNSGSGTGAITAVSLKGGAGSAFQVVSLAPLPIFVGPAQELSFGIRFSPLAQQAYTDVLSATAGAQNITVNVQGQGVQSSYSYQFTGSAGTTTVSSGGTVPIPNTAVGQSTSLSVTVTNTGMAAGQVSGIGVTGAGLSLSNLPVGFPIVIQPGGTEKFTLTFAPQQAGAITGTLTFGTDTITLTTTAEGPQLNYTYTSGSTTVPVPANGAVTFSPLAVGSSETMTFSVQNTGTTAATISSIEFAAPSATFQLSGVPALPATLNPSASITFSIVFAPDNTGNLGATLFVNDVGFTVSGNGTQPPSLPAYTFSGASGTEQPAQQPSVGLALASPYPLALQGTLTLSFASSVFAGDTSIQFANGASTVGFTIPANTTQAMFSGGATAVPLQTGTTSGNIVITPSFSLQNGFNLTPSSPTLLTLAIPGLAPQLVNAGISSIAANGFTLTLSGYTTTRDLNQLNIQFTPVAGKTFNPSQLTIDLSSASASWFQQTAAAGFGGSFLVEVPFSLSGGNATTSNLVSSLQSLSVTATNNIGTSTSLAVIIP